MKPSFTLLLLLTLLLFNATSSARNNKNVNLEDFSTGKIEMKSLETAHTPVMKHQMHQKQGRKEQHRHDRLRKFEDRIQKRLASASVKQHKRGIDNLSDSTDRWFWLGAGSWTLGILITIIAGGTIGTIGLGIFWLLTFAFGAFSLICWLKKRYGA